MAVSVKIDDETKQRLRRLAEARKRTPHHVMREAIAQYLDREEKREGFLQEALAAWKDYQETGRHLTGAELQAWLSTWGTEDEAEAPECHD